MIQTECGSIAWGRSTARALGLAVALAAPLLMACSDPAANTGRALPSGEFLLVWVDGFPLPFESPECATFPQDCQSSIENGEIAINEGGTFRLTLTWRHQWPGKTAEGAVDITGNVRVVEGALEFTWTNPANGDAAVVMRAVFERDGFSIVRLPLAATCCEPFQWTPESQISTARLRFGRL